VTAKARSNALVLDNILACGQSAYSKPSVSTALVNLWPGLRGGGCFCFGTRACLLAPHRNGTATEKALRPIYFLREKTFLRLVLLLDIIGFFEA
jgi:hypothetical protein